MKEARIDTHRRTCGPYAQWKRKEMTKRGGNKRQYSKAGSRQALAGESAVIVMMMMNYKQQR